jgi:hypothetical protein
MGAVPQSFVALVALRFTVCPEARKQSTGLLVATLILAALPASSRA